MLEAVVRTRKHAVVRERKHASRASTVPVHKRLPIFGRRVGRRATEPARAAYAGALGTTGRGRESSVGRSFRMKSAVDGRVASAYQGAATSTKAPSTP